MKRRHFWSPNPNTAHCICTACGCRRDHKTEANGKTRVYYTLTSGEVTTTASDCNFIDYNLL